MSWHYEVDNERIKTIFFDCVNYNRQIQRDNEQKKKLRKIKVFYRRENAS